MALFGKIVAGIVLAIGLFFVVMVGYFFWATNGGSAEGWFRGLISDPIPASVSELRYGGEGGFDSTRCFSFRISPADLEILMKKYSFGTAHTEWEKERFSIVFKQSSKIPVGNLDGYKAFSATEYTPQDQHAGISRTLLVSPGNDHVYCLIET